MLSNVIRSPVFDQIQKINVTVWGKDVKQMEPSEEEEERKETRERERKRKARRRGKKKNREI